MKLIITDSLISVVTFVSYIYINSSYMELFSTTWFVRISLLVIKIKLNIWKLRKNRYM